MNKKRKKIVRLCWALGILLCFMVLFILLGGVEKVRQLSLYTKAPSAYTWDEYQAMDNKQKDKLFQRFDSLEDFETWMESVQPKETEPDFHWDQSGRQPNEYTWEEYEALSLEKKEAFYQWFASKDAFEVWMNEAKPAETIPADPTWDIPGKTPNEYTWGEYLALPPEQQDAFYHWFGSVKEFEAWMDAVKPDANEFENAAWDKPGKKPNEYTWDEYQALTPEDQELFYQWFGSMDAFEIWLDQAEKE